jgi:hypothetical protein
MNSIDIKSFIIGVLLTSTVIFATGWQAGTQKVRIENWPGCFAGRNVSVVPSGSFGVDVKGWPSRTLGVDVKGWPSRTLKVKESQF